MERSFSHIYRPGNQNLALVHIGRGDTFLAPVGLYPGEIFECQPGHRTIFFSQLRTEPGPWTRQPEKDERISPRDPLRPSPLRYELYPSNERGKSWLTGIANASHFQVLYRRPTKKPMAEKRSTYFHYASYLSRRAIEYNNSNSGKPFMPPRMASWGLWSHPAGPELVLQAEKRKKVRELRRPSPAITTELCTLFDKIARLVTVTRAETKNVERYHNSEDPWNAGGTATWDEQSDEQTVVDSEGTVAEMEEEGSYDEDVGYTDTSGMFVSSSGELVGWKKLDSSDFVCDDSLVKEPDVEDGVGAW